MARGTFSSGNYLDTGSAIVTATPLTFACWFYANSLSSTPSELIQVAQAGGSNYFALETMSISGTNYVVATTLATTPAQALQSGVSTSTWQHAVATFASATSRYAYLNGTGSTNSTSRTPSSLDETTIGKNQGAGSVQAFDGYIADVAIWNIALGVAPIAELAAGASPLMVRPDRLVFYAPLIRTVTQWRGIVPIENGTVGVADHPRIYYPIRPYVILPAATGAYTLNLDAGSYTVTGKDPAITADRALALETGSYTITGHDATLTIDRVLSLEAGSYTVMGQDATLTYSGTDYSLSLDAGSYTITGHDVALTVDRVLSLDAGSYAVTGNDPAITVARTLSLDAGTYTVTGLDASLVLARALALNAGTYTVTGQNVTLTYSAEVTGATVELTDAALYAVELTDAALYAVELTDSALYGVELADAVL